METDARIIHKTLNQIIVGKVLIVDVITRTTLERRAKIYSHHHCLPKRRPGKIIEILVANEIASTVLTRSQYDLSPNRRVCTTIN